MSTQTHQYSNHRDTPLRRFNSFWWGLAFFALFGIVSSLVVAFSKRPKDAEAHRKDSRMELRATVDAAQAKQLEGMEADKMTDAVKMKSEKSSKFVPGSEGEKRANQAASAGAKPGKAIYLAKNCATCHGADGKSPTAQIYPSLAGKDTAYLIKAMSDIKSGARTTALTPAMKPFIGMCSEDDIKAIAEWLADK